MVANIETDVGYRAAKQLYEQARALDPNRFPEVDPNDILRAEAFGMPRIAPVKLTQILVGPDAGKLTLEERTATGWKPIPGIIPVDYSNKPIQGYPQ